MPDLPSFPEVYEQIHGKKPDGADWQAWKAFFVSGYAAQKFMVVPKDTPLIIRTRIDPIHIDQVHVGQEAALRFSAFDQRTTPELVGHVTAVSADAYHEERLGMSYYEADIALDDGMLEKLDHVTLMPGMPVETFIRTHDRSALSYFVKPMSDYFTRAFRDG